MNMTMTMRDKIRETSRHSDDAIWETRLTETLVTQLCEYHRINDNVHDFHTQTDTVLLLLSLLLLFFCFKTGKTLHESDLGFKFKLSQKISTRSIWMRLIMSDTYIQIDSHLKWIKTQLEVSVCSHWNCCVDDCYGNWLR